MFSIKTRLPSLTAIPVAELEIKILFRSTIEFSPTEIALSPIFSNFNLEIFIFEPEKSNPSPIEFKIITSFNVPVQISQSKASDLEFFTKN